MEHKKLMKNKVYLYLLLLYNGKIMPGHSELGRRIGCTRQTVAKKIAELLDNNIININEHKEVKVENVLNLNVYELKEVLKELGNEVSDDEIFDKDKDKEIKELLNKESVLYGIIVDGELKYVGCTDRYEDRMFEHIKKRNFLTKNNFVILNKENNRNKFAVEKELIHMLKPEWNLMGLSHNERKF